MPTGKFNKPLSQMCLFDDVFMTACLDGENECVEYILKILLNKDLKVIKAKGQEEIPNLHGQKVRLDIKAIDENGKQYNIEVQRDNRGALPKRARRNASILDANIKDAGLYGEKLPETYIIFITEQDIWHQNKSLYPIERFILCGDRYLPFPDDLHILYVNGSWTGDDPIGQLMKDFHCTRSTAMSNSPLRERVGQLKGDMQGGSPMGTMLDKAEERGMEKQRKLDEAEMKRQAARIAELEAELAALKAEKEK